MSEKRLPVICAVDSTHTHIYLVAYLLCPCGHMCAITLAEPEWPCFRCRSVWVLSDTHMRALRVAARIKGGIAALDLGPEEIVLKESPASRS